MSSTSLTGKVETSHDYEEFAALPGHLIQLEDQPWALWRWVGVRATGFPVGQVLELSTPKTAEIVDQLLGIEDEVTRLRRQAIQLLREELNSLRHENREQEHARSALLAKAVRRVWTGKPVEPSSVPTKVAVLLQELSEAQRKIAASKSELKSAFQTETARISERLQQTAASQRFREAVIWQNRHALHGSIRAFLRLPPDDKSRGNERRKREELIARYLQRYCVKNDTIGFFGPVGWAQLTRNEEMLAVQPGPTLLAHRNTYFEGWCIDTLARKLSRDKSLLPWFAPRRVPFASVEDHTLYCPPRPPTRLSTAEAEVLKKCDGVLTAREIARQLVQGRTSQLDSEEAVFSVLKILRNKGVISWTLEIPLELHPERTLRRILEGVEDERLRRSALEPLNQLEKAREVVSCAAGDPEKLDLAMAELENTFTRLTGVASTRSGGQLYAGRTLVYEDCCRDLTLDIGNELVQSLGRPLSLLLFTARWFSFELAAAYRRAFESIYEERTRKSATKTIEFVEFWGAARSLLVDEGSRPVDALLQTYRKRWLEVLSPRSDERRLQYSTEELRPLILKAFAAPRPGWMSACYHSPDIMIAASSIEAIRRGDFQFILGELHGGMNTLGFSVFLAQHPNSEELFRAVECDLPEPLIVPVISKYLAPEQTVRVFLTLISSKDYRLEIAPDSRCPSDSKVLSLGTLLVEKQDGRLVLRTRDGRLQFDIIEAFGVGLSDIMVDAFKILSPAVAGKQPRITIDNLVISREAWTFGPEEMEFVLQEDQMERFLAARRWSRVQQLPRFVFVKAPVEEKPFYLDFDSPVYVDIFAKTVRRTLESETPHKLITLSEMLPGPHQAWLPDVEGNRYSSELRMVAYDTATRAAPV